MTSYFIEVETVLENTHLADLGLDENFEYEKTVFNMYDINYYLVGDDKNETDVSLTNGQYLTIRMEYEKFKKLHSTIIKIHSI